MQWCNQDFFSRPSPRPKPIGPSVEDQDQDFASQDQDQDFFWCRLEADRKAFFIFGRKRKCRRKWNSIYSRKRKEHENGHSFSAEKRKWKSPDNISVFVFFFFSYIQSPSQPYNGPLIPRLVSTFLQVVRVDGIPFSSCTVYRYLCGIFLDDISTREQFAFLVYCYQVKAIFHNLCTVLYWRLCGLTYSPHC